MRSLSKSLAGGVLATLLVLSASPAQAFGPQDPVPGTEADQTDLDANGSDAPLDGTEQSDGTDPVENSDPADGAADVDGTDGAAVETEDPATAEPDVSDEALAEDQAEGDVPPVETAAPDADKTVTEVPASIPLSGRFLLLPHEHNPAETEADAAAEADLISRVLLMTDSGAFLPVDVSALNDPISGDSEFTGSAPMPETARVAVAAQIEADGALSESEVLDTVNEAVLDTEEQLLVSGTVSLPVEAFSDAPMGAAPAKRGHTADVVFFGGGRGFTETMIRSLMSQSGTYWKSQSNGAVTGLSVKKYKKLNPSYNLCNQDGLWGQAAKSFGATENTYTNGHHLIVVVDSPNGCSQAGLADIGSNIHSGGVVWVNLTGWSQYSNPVSQGTVNKSLSTLSHELGHNMSLGHSQSRVCSGRTIDAATGWKDDEQNVGKLRVLKPVGSACKDVEYGNTWDLMGHTNSAGAKPVALGLAQRTALGVNPSGSVRTVQASGGRSQNFTLNPMGNNAGLRGLKVTNPRGESFYVEYRNNVGQDSRGPNSTAVYSADGTTAVTSGVVVSKSYPTARIRWSDGSWRPYAAKRSTALTYYKTAGSYADRKHLAMAKGGMSTPVSSIARVRVTNIASGKANVRVEFTPFIDVTYDQKFAKEINWMSSAKLSTGINAGGGLRKYAPKSNVTREAMAAFLYRLNTPAGASAPKGYKIPKKSPFKDVPTNHKFYNEIAWMSTSKLSTGIKSGSGKIYAPKAGVTREAMAAFIYRMDKSTKPTPPKTSPFSDMTPRTKFYKEIAWMSTSGLSTGIKQSSGKPKYAPKNKVTREAMAAFIYRLKH